MTLRGMLDTVSESVQDIGQWYKRARPKCSTCRERLDDGEDIVLCVSVSERRAYHVECAPHQ